MFSKRVQLFRITIVFAERLSSFSKFLTVFLFHQKYILHLISIKKSSLKKLAQYCTLNA